MFQNCKKLIYTDNKIAKAILPAGYATITLGLFVLSKCKELSDKTINHENIHREQFVEFAIVGFMLGLFVGICYIFSSIVPIIVLPFVFALLAYYVWYGIEYVISFVAHLFVKHDKEQSCSYHASCLEMEAYAFENEPDYLARRHPFAWTKYLGVICGKKS